MKKAETSIPVVFGVVLSLIGGLTGAAVAVGLVHAAWSPFHAAAMQTASDALEQDRRERADELARLAVAKQRATDRAGSRATELLVEAEGPLFERLTSVETARDAAQDLVKKEQATFAAIAAERDTLATGVNAARKRAAAAAETAAAIEREQKEALQAARSKTGLPDELVSSTGIRLMLIPAGTFVMGSAADDGEAGSSERPAHEVTISRPYYLGVYEVTNAQWKQVMRNVPSNWKADDLPVEQVSWIDVQEFCRKLSALPEERQAGRVYRLPTEAEWEYACRAGTTTKFSFGDDASLLGDFAWFDDNAGGQTHPVGQKRPNPWGLYDMHGNVWEWCSDWDGDYDSDAVTDPQGPARVSTRVVRGGSWWNTARGCRSANRSWSFPSNRSGGIGFRLALSPSGVSPPEAGE